VTVTPTTTEANSPQESAPAPDTPKFARPGAFIAYLMKLLSENDPTRTDRQALAELRGVLRGTTADYLRAARHVAPFLGDEPGDNDRWFYEVGALLALHPKHTRPTGKQKYGPSLGAALGELRGDSGSMDSRVLALLGTPADALRKPLRQMISLLEQGRVGLDYARLLNDLSHWNHPDDWVQKKWARDYFRSGNADAAAPDAETTDTTENEDE
jgi:CRISPR system Cascade subunit CasB